MNLGSYIRNTILFMSRGRGGEEGNGRGDGRMGMVRVRRAERVMVIRRVGRIGRVGRFPLGNFFICAMGFVFKVSRCCHAFERELPP